MMTRKHVSAGQASTYYEADDYYTEGGLMPAQWGGKLATELGLSGAFDQQKFAKGLRGEFDNHEFKQRPSRKRAGLDCCFSAPKSVSIMALVKGDARIVAAHDAAVRKAMERVEAAASCRLTENGKTTAVEVSGIAYGSFRHDTSRLGDANLHTHNVILKAVMGPDGKLHALHADKMFAEGWRHEMDAAYKAVLAQELRVMGYSLIMTKDGFEIEGVSPKLIAEFSQRSQQIEQALEARGMSREESSASARQAANLSTRSSKKIYDRVALSRWWNDRVDFIAKHLGLLASNLTPAFSGEISQVTTHTLDTTETELNHENEIASDYLGLDGEPPPFRRDRVHHLSELNVDEDPRRAQMLLPSDVRNDLDNQGSDRDPGMQRDGNRQEERGATRGSESAADSSSKQAEGQGPDQTRRAEESAAAGSASGQPDRLSADGALALALEHVMERNSVITSQHMLITHAVQFSEFRVTAEQIGAAIQTAIASGELIVGSRGRMTTRGALESEKAVDAAYETGRGSCKAIADAAFSEQKLAEVEAKLGGKMTAGQRDMVEKITMGTNRVMVVEGDAGTGKSTGMEAVKKIAEAKGFNVLGLAPSAQAVESLQAAGIDTITSQSGKFNEKFWERVNSKTILIMDEAGLVDARTMCTILEKVKERGARIAVTGDDKQFASVEAGRALYQLNKQAMEHGEGIRLDEMRRGRNDEMRGLHFAARDNPLEALDKLFSSGQVTVYQNDAKRIEAIATAYAAIPEAERVKTLVLTGTNADRVAINTAIREALGRTGGTEINTFERNNVTKAQARQLAYYEAGDIVRFETASDGFKKGEMLRVLEKTSDKIILERGDGSRVDFHPHRQANNVSIGSEERIAILAGERIRFTSTDKAKEIANGDRGTVIAIERDRIRIQLDKGKEVFVPLGGKDPLSLRYGMCTTGHSAQGATATNVLLHIKSTDVTVDRKSWYTNITRAALTVRLFTDAFEGKRLAALRKAISFSKNKELAHEVVSEQDKAPDVERLTYIGAGKGIEREDLAADSSKAAIAEALTRAQERFGEGEKLHIEGSKAFQKLVVQVAAEQGLDVKFTDRKMQAQLQDLKTPPTAKAERSQAQEPAPKSSAESKAATKKTPTGPDWMQAPEKPKGAETVAEWLKAAEQRRQENAKESADRQKDQQQTDDLTRKHKLGIKGPGLN